MDGMETDKNQHLRDAAREYAEAWVDYKNERRKADAVRELEAAARAFAAPPNPDIRGFTFGGMLHTLELAGTLTHEQVEVLQAGHDSDIRAEKQALVESAPFDHSTDYEDTRALDGSGATIPLDGIDEGPLGYTTSLLAVREEPKP